MSDLESSYFYYTETGLICLVLFFHFKFVAQCNQFKLCLILKLFKASLILNSLSDAS